MCTNLLHKPIKKVQLVLSASPTRARTHTPFPTVQRAVEVKAADPNGKSDPYCIIHLGSPGEQLHKTEVINGTLSPEWDEKCIIQSKQLSPYVFTAGMRMCVI